ncbi:MAG: LysR family transcriptional regulator [Archaeoglobus sp.]|nr:LysR family transcriptional regulator [Archaeoglobus sp.]
MRTFLKVVEKGSLKAAAKELGMSVSSVSFQINALEEFYGAKLLNRKVTGVTLTEEGIIAMKNMESILGSIEDAKKLIANLREDKITIASGMVGLNIVFHLQSLLKAKYPALEVNVVLRGAHECTRLLNRGEVDFAIAGDISEDVEDDKFKIDLLGKDWLVLITPLNHPLASKEEVTLEDVMKYPLIFLTDDYGINTSVKKALEESGYKDVKPSIVVGDFFSKLNSVSSNLGIAITSMIAAAKAYEVGLVKMKPIKDLVDERDIYLITSHLCAECKRMVEYHNFILENAKRMLANYQKTYLLLH